MRKYSLVGGLGLLGLGLSSLSLSSAAPRPFQDDFTTTKNTQSQLLQGYEKAKKRYIVKFKSDSSNDNLANQSPQSEVLAPNVAERAIFMQARKDLIERIGGETQLTLSSLNAFSATLDESSIDELRNNPSVEYVEVDPIREFQAEVQPYGIAQIQADFLSDSGTSNMKVCIADTGYSLNHEDLPSSINITGEVSNSLLREVDLGVWYEDTYGHGTHMAGTIAAIGGNGVGTSGVHPSGNINLHIVKIIHNPNWWPVYGSDMIAAAERCVEAGANVINFSISGTGYSQAEADAMQAAYDSGVIIVSAAGKYGSSDYFYPASYDSVISVAAIDKDEKAWIYNQRNDQIEVSAAGVNVKSTTRNNNYSYWDGTSIASAYTSGGIALLWSHHPECTNDEIRNIVHLTAKDLGEAGRDETYGFGVMQIKAGSELINEAGCDGIRNDVPTISGHPDNSVSVNDRYVFVPVALDTDDDPLNFKVNNLPNWAEFDESTGTISGIPSVSDIGVTNDITLTVTDGELEATLPAFSISVIASIFDEWADDGTGYDHTGWTPVIAEQLTGFTQTQHYQQDQIQLEQKRKLNEQGIEIDNGEPVVHSRTLEQSRSRIINVEVGNWVNNGNFTNCSEWAPARETVEYGKEFEQSRDCDQPQQRTRHYESDGSNGDSTTIVDISKLDEQVISVVKTKSSTGTKRDWQTIDSTFTEWENTGERYEFGTWLQAPDKQQTSYTQTRNFKQAQQRFEQPREKDSFSQEVRNKGDRVKHTQVITGNESRNVLVDWSGWSNQDEPYEFEEWSPSAEDKLCTLKVDQSRSYKQKQQGSYTHKVDGTTIHTDSIEQVITKSQSRAVDGQQPDWKVHTSTFTDWINVGERYEHSAWIPSASNQTSDYEQSRLFKQDQQRMEQKRERDTCTGTIRSSGEPVAHKKYVSPSEKRLITVSWSGWTDEGSPKDFTNWTPSNADKLCTVDVAQTRAFKQPQAGTYTHRFGNKVEHTHQVTRDEPKEESQTVKGQFPNWVSHPSTFTNWEDYGGQYEHGAWTPAFGYQTSNYTQTRAYKQKQRRFEQKRRQDTCANTIENVGTPIPHIVPRNRTEGPRTITVSWSGWTDEGSPKGFTNWTPSTADKLCSVNVTQTRSYIQPQVGTYTHRLGSQVEFTRPVTNDDSREQTQVQSGDLPDWRHHEPVYTLYENVGGRYDYSSWSPVPGSQTSNYNQTRTYKQSQRRRKQNQEINVCTGEIRNVGSPSYQTRVVNGTETRLITVNLSGWENIGGRYGYSNWTPDRNSRYCTDTFNQTRSFKQDQVRKYIHKLGSSTIHTRNAGNRTITGSESNPNNPVSGTVPNWVSYPPTYSGWEPVGPPYNYSSWTPAPGSQQSGYSQSRTAKQNERRFEQQRQKDTCSGNIVNVGSPIQHDRVVTISDSRPVSVSPEYRTLSGRLNYTPWTPDASNQSCTIDVRQTRSYQRKKQIRYIHKVGSSTIYTSSWSDLSIVTFTESRTVKGELPNWQPHTSETSPWTNEGSGYDYSAWTPALTTQQSSYSRTRTYKQKQTRTVQERERDTCSGNIRDKGPLKTERQSVPKTQSGSNRIITTTFRFGEWYNSGAGYSYSSWFPHCRDHYKGQRYLAERTYKQKQLRSSTILNIWATGETNVKSTSILSRVATMMEEGWKTGCSGHYIP